MRGNFTNHKIISIVDRFWAKVGLLSIDECWPWLACKDKDGYGILDHIRAHRFSLELKLGRRIKTGMEACHTCDNPSCVNPKHLYEGTLQDNKMDMVIRGRSTKGIKNPMAKLSDDDVVKIRNLLADGDKSQNNIASLFGVTQGAVCYIKNKGWRHVVKSGMKSAVNCIH